MNQLASIALLFGTVLPVAGTAESGPDLTGETARINYSVGYQVGSDFRRQELDIRPDTVLRGIEDALSGAKPAITPQEMQSAMAKLGERVADQKKRARAEALQRLAQQETAFLLDNSKKAGVKVTASGLQYQVLKEGAGPTPSPNDTVTIRFQARLVDGERLDSPTSEGKPVSFRADGVIPGWREALAMMRPGASWTLVVPAKLGFQDPHRLAGRVVVYDMDLLSVESAAAVPAPTAPTSAPGRTPGRAAPAATP